jgi:hypothetical protein
VGEHRRIVYRNEGVVRALAALDFRQVANTPDEPEKLPDKVDLLPRTRRRWLWRSCAKVYADQGLRLILSRELGSQDG